MSSAFKQARYRLSGAFCPIAANSMFLSALQELTYLVSFLTVPYLPRTLGASHFGSSALADTVTARFILVLAMLPAAHAAYPRTFHRFCDGLQSGAAVAEVS